VGVIDGVVVLVVVGELLGGGVTAAVFDIVGVIVDVGVIVGVGVLVAVKLFVGVLLGVKL